MIQTFPVFGFTSIRQTLSQLTRNRMGSYGYRTSLFSVLLVLALSSLSLGQSLSVSMSYPAFRSSFITGSQVNIQTTTTTPASTTVTKVEFFLATFTGPGNSKVTVKLGEDLTAPFSYTWTIPDGQVSYNELSAVVTNTTGATAVQGGTGYIRVDVYPPNTNSNKKYYVQASASATNTAGTLAAPFNTIQKAVDLVQPGDSVFVMAGTYTNTGTNDAVIIRRTGTADHWIVFTNYQNEKPKVSFNGYQGFNLVAGAAYIKIQGFEVVGNNANVTLPQATTQPGSCDNPTGTVNPAFNGNGISLNGRTGGNMRPHHIVLANNTIHDCGGGGISAIESDYVTVENNTVYNNSWYTIFGTSGISFLNSWNYDDNTNTAKMIIRNNICYGNRLFVRWINGGVCRGITDGNGIILDNNNNQFGTTNPNGAYNGKFLIENNICYQNGGRGVNINYSDNATVRNNTFYQNAASPEITSEFAMRYATSVRIYNNIFYSRSDKATGAPVNSLNLLQSNNLTFGGTDTPFFTGPQSLTGVDPQFADAAGGNFQLTSTSPALNAGSSTAEQYALKDILGISRPQGAGVDMGAYELQGASLSITQQPASSSVVCAGTGVSVSVAVDGPVQAYQWYKDGNALTGVTSATTATLSLSAVTVADQGNYSVVVSGSTSLTSSAFSLTVNAPPAVSIAANPSLTATTGSSVTLTASGADTYRWNTGATSAVLSASTAATYSVTGTTANGCSATATATVVLLGPPTVSMPFPQFNSSYISGTDINIQATATTPAGTTITKVEFFYDAAFSGTYTKIGEDLTAPYSITWTAPAVPANGRSYQIRAIVTNSASATAVSNAPTNYVGITVYPANYISTRNWYVNASASATNTAGTEALPFNTIQKAADRVAPGDTVFVMAGTYTGTSTNIAGIQRTGLSSKWIVFMPYKTDRPVLALGNNNWQAFNVLPAAAYIKIQGFEIIGNNANITLAQAQAQPGACEGSSPAATPTPRFNGNGISISGRSGGNVRPHHVVLANNYIHDCAGGGISAIESDYVTIEDNITANTSWYTVYGSSGISVFNSWNYDNTTTTPRMIVRRNRSFGNILKIAWNIGGTGTNCKFYDGNGIILDNNRGADPNNANAIKNSLGDYTGKFLLENNLCYKNGGRGININYSDNAIVLNNTTYQNGQSDGSFGIGIDNEFIMQGSIGARIFSNIFYGKPGENPSSVSGSSDILQNNNLTFSTVGNGYFTNNQNIVGQDPQFVDAATGDFRLASISPAINAGSSTAGQYAAKDILGIDRPQGSGVDIGAYEFQGTPLSFSQQPASGSAVCVGASVSTSVVADGPVQAYQWYKDGHVLTGVTAATTATLSLSAVTAADQGSYYVVITGFNSLTSSAFKLTINTPPTASLAASGTISCTTPVITLTAASGSNLTYSFGNGATQIGTGNTATVSQAGTYSVLVTSLEGCFASASVDVSGSLVTPDAPNVSSVSATQGAGNVTLTVTNCSGTVNWNGTDGSSSLVVPTSAVGEFVYAVTCKVGICVSPVTSVTVSVKAPPAMLSVYYRDDANNQPTSNTIRPFLKLNNEGNTAVPYSEITVRYWLTVENFSPMTNLSVYWAQLGANNVRMKYVSLTQPRQGALGYVEYSFDASAGSLAANSNSGEIQNGIGKQNWTNFDQTNDYSYAPNAMYTKTDHITVYRNGALVWGAEPPTIQAVSSLKVYAENRNNYPATNQISTYLNLANEGNSPVDYSQLTVRYWFSAEGANPLTYNVDYAELGSSNIKSKFVKENRAGTDTYLELSFVPTLGQLNPLSSTGIIQQRINKSDWSNFNEANDYSYQPAGALVENAKITAYLNGTLVYGQEPGPAGARVGVESLGLRVAVLGNPIQGDAVQLDVTGVEGQPLRAELFDSRGQLVTKHQVGQAATSEHIRLPVGRSPAGVLVLRVSTLTESQTLKLIKP